MPIYEYQCVQCGNKFEIRCSLNDIGVPVKCPQCKAGNPKRLFSSFATNQSSSACAPTGNT